MTAYNVKSHNDNIIKMCRLLWGKHEGDGVQLSPLQSMGSGFSAACLGPVCTGPFDVIKASLHSVAG